MSLTPSVGLGLRHDGGDAEAGAGMDVGGGLAFTDTVTGLSVDMRVRTLLVYQAEGFSDRGMSLSFGWDPSPSSPLGLTATVAPSWGGSAMGGAEALWNSQMSYGMGSHQMYGARGQVNAEVGYGLPLGLRFVGTPWVGYSASSYGRDYRMGYSIGLLDSEELQFEVGVDAPRRETHQMGAPATACSARPASAGRPACARARASVYCLGAPEVGNPVLRGADHVRSVRGEASNAWSGGRGVRLYCQPYCQPNVLQGGHFCPIQRKSGTVKTQ